MKPETVEEPSVIVPEDIEVVVVREKEKTVDVSAWIPKTIIGKKVKAGEITDIDELFSNGFTIREAEIVDVLIPTLENDLLLIGQAKGKFGGGKRRVFRQTQKKTREGNKPHFAALMVVGNRNGYVGMGVGKAKETVPAREKSSRNAKLNIIKIRRGCGSWACACGTAHTIPFKVMGKAGSVSVELIPAPKGTGLVAEEECQKILKLAGVQDVWSKARGTTTTKINLVNACFNALKELTKVKVSQESGQKLSMQEGVLKHD